MISDNIIKFRFTDFPLHADQMIKSLIVFGSSRCLHRWQAVVDLYRNQTGIDHRIFSFTRMNIKSPDFKFCFAGIKILVLNLPFTVTIQSISILCAKLIQIEMFRSHSNFLIRSKCYTNHAMRPIFCLDSFNHSQNLCNSCFVICSQNRCSIRSEQCTSF